MKVAVSSQGPSLDSLVDARFGRAAFFVLADTETGASEAVANDQNLAAAQGAGIQAASAVARSGASAVLTGHCGPKAFRALSAAGLGIYVGVSGTVAEALEQFKAGTLARADQPDVEGHWT
jgi:predicted Fe-Mo cluster-binding NifX family protein